MGEEQIIINKTYRANSREFGNSKDRIKLYFEDPQDLLNQINELKKLGLWSTNLD
jgi:hypothetical protein